MKIYRVYLIKYVSGIWNFIKRNIICNLHIICHNPLSDGSCSVLCGAVP